VPRSAARSPFANSAASSVLESCYC
jgi:hypothetical protein